MFHTFLIRFLRNIAGDVVSPLRGCSKSLERSRYLLQLEFDGNILPQGFALLKANKRLDSVRSYTNISLPQNYKSATQQSTSAGKYRLAAATDILAFRGCTPQASTIPPPLHTRYLSICVITESESDWGSSTYEFCPVVAYEN